MEDLIGDLTAVPQPIEIELFGTDPVALHDAAERTAGAIGKIKGVVEVVDGLRVAGDAVTVTVNRPAAAVEGLDADAISRQLSTLIDGSKVTSPDPARRDQRGRSPVDASSQRDSRSIGALRLQA